MSRSRFNLKTNLWPPGLIFILALAAALLVTHVFEQMPHLEDEFANYFQAQVFASGQLSVPSPVRPDSFLIPFAIDLNGRRFSKYPPGFAAVLALGIKAKAGWLVNPLLGALLLLAVYGLGRDLYDAETGLLAAMLGLLSPMFLGLSAALLPHTLAALCLLIFAWACLRAIRTARQTPVTSAAPATHAWRSLAPAAGGLALGWAALTRPYTALVYALPFGLLAAWFVVRTRRRSLVSACALIGLVGGALAAMLPLYGRALTGQYTVDLYTLVWPYDRLGFGPGHGVLPGGHTLNVAAWNAYIDLWSLTTELLGWPYLSWLPVLLGLVLPPRRRLDGLLLAPFVCIVAAYGAYWIQGSGLYGPRYYYEALPLVWLLAARGLLKLWRGLPRPSNRRIRLRLAMQVALAALVAINALGVIPMRLALWRGLYGITRAPGRQIAQLDIHNALIFVRIRHWGDYSELAWTNNLSLDSDIVFALDEGPPANAIVLAAYPERRVFRLANNVLEEVKRDK